MTTIHEPQYWQLQIKATMPGQKPQSELLLAEKRTHKQAVEYCVNRWGDRFKIATLKPYDPIKVSKLEDGRLLEITASKRIELLRKEIEHKKEMRKNLKLKPKPEKRLWMVTLANGEQKDMTSFKRTLEQATKAATSRYGQQVKFIEEWHELPK